MKKYTKEQGLHEKILSGVNKLADNVASTMGPRGRTVMIKQSGRAPIVTKDGVSVARFVDFEDPFEDAAASIIKQAAEETNSSAGDGTTTATVLARAIINKAQKYVVAGNSPIEIKRGIELAVKHLVAHIKASSVPISSIDDVINIATISANGDEVVGRLIGEAVDSIGKDGSITIKEGGAIETSVDIVEGFRFDSGIASSKFITNERLNLMKYDNPYLLITDTSISQVSQILPALELVARSNKPLVIVADEVVDEALAAIIMNVVRGSLKVAAIKAPAFGAERREILNDLAITVGATFFSEEDVEAREIESVELKDLGSSASIEATRNKTTIVNGAGSQTKIEERIASLDEEIKDSEDLRECEKFQSRIARLASSVAVIYVGGKTQVEMIEKKHRIEDALEAVRSAQTEGMVEGAGVALLRAKKCLIEVETEHQQQAAGVKLMSEVCEAPIRQILENAGINPDLVIRDIEQQEKNEIALSVFDLVKEDYVDAFENGIIDPAKVTRCALENAASAACALITTNYAIIEVE